MFDFWNKLILILRLSLSGVIAFFWFDTSEMKLQFGVVCHHDCNFHHVSG